MREGKEAEWGERMKERRIKRGKIGGKNEAEVGTGRRDEG